MRQLNVNFPRKITEFEHAMKKRFLIKTIFYKRVFRGKGSEFEGYRRYNSSEDFSLIDWKASLRTKEMLVRKYTEERDLKIFLIIDIGENMVSGSGKQLKSEIAAEIAACLGHLVILSGDGLGFALYNEKIYLIKDFVAGIKQFYFLEKNLKDAKIYGKKSDLKSALKFLIPRIRKSSAVFIISDFLNVDQECFNLLKEFSFKYETIGIMVRDNIDLNLPDLNREVVIEDINTGKQLLINPGLIKYEYEKHAFEQKKNVEDFFKKNRADLLNINTGQDFVVPLVDFLKLRAKTKKYILPKR